MRVNICKLISYADEESTKIITLAYIDSLTAFLPTRFCDQDFILTNHADSFLKYTIHLADFVIMMTKFERKKAVIVSVLCSIKNRMG